MIQYINYLFFKIPPLQKKKKTLLMSSWSKLPPSQKYKFTAMLLIHLFLKRKKD